MGNQLLVTKEYSWDMAHMLSGHEGLCRNVHGHTYKMHLTVKSTTDHLVSVEEDTNEGMVVDFKELKTLVHRAIVEPLDHAFMTNVKTKNEAELELVQVMYKHKMKVYEVEFRPTAENMAISIYDTLDDLFYDLKKPYEVVSVKIWETPTSFAEYTGGSDE